MCRLFECLQLAIDIDPSAFFPTCLNEANPLYVYDIFFFEMQVQFVREAVCAKCSLFGIQTQNKFTPHCFRIAIRIAISLR